ncbi:MAG: thioredoxin family protein [Candidatus Thorarchaeota archaeon]|nr:thioredoxin family protein [Candidatus Thorarchaeota archaeon]
MVDLNEIRSRTTNTREYIDSLRDKDKEKFLEVYNNYKLNADVVDELRDALKDLTVVVFTAAWCGDCKRAMPVMMQIEEQIGLEVLVFSKIKTAPLDPDRQWAVPPSPPDIDEWGVTAIPWFNFYDTDGNLVANLIEKPTVKETLEAEILHVLKNK